MQHMGLIMKQIMQLLVPPLPPPPPLYRPPHAPSPEHLRLKAAAIRSRRDSSRSSKSRRNYHRTSSSSCSSSILSPCLPHVSVALPSLLLAASPCPLRPSTRATLRQSCCRCARCQAERGSYTSYVLSVNQRFHFVLLFQPEHSPELPITEPRSHAVTRRLSVQACLHVPTAIASAPFVTVRSHSTRSLLLSWARRCSCYLCGRTISSLERPSLCSSSLVLPSGGSQRLWPPRDLAGSWWPTPRRTAAPAGNAGSLVLLLVHSMLQAWML